VSRSWIHPLCWAGLALFTAYLLIVNRDYYRADTQVPSYDEAWYLETSLHLYQRLTGASLGEFWDSYKTAFGVKAPLIAVLPLPFYLLYGAGPYAAMLVNSAFIVIASVYLFLLARRLFSPEVGLASVVFYQTMPLAYGLSRSFMTEYGLAALVIVSLYYLVASEYFTQFPANLALGVALGLGLLMKILFAAFVAGPLLLVWLRRNRFPAFRRPLAAVAVPAVAIAATWYAYNLPSLLRFAWTNAYGELGEQYSAGGLFPWLLLFINQGLSAYYTLVLAILGLLALAANRRRLAALARDERTWLLLAWLVPPFVAAAAARNHLIRFVLPLLPVFAMALAVAIFHLGRRWILQAVLAVLLAVYPQRLFANLSYPHHGEGREAVLWGPLILYASDLGWARPPVWEDPWEHRRLLEALRRLAPDALRPYYAVVGVDHVYLNANLLNYLSTYHKYPMRFTSLGYAETSARRAVQRLFALDTRFLILVEGLRDLPPFLNRVNEEIAGLVAGGELPYSYRAEVALAPPVRAAIYELEAPWDRFPPGASEPAPSLPRVADLVPGVRFLGCDWKRRGGGDLWEIAAYWTATGRVREDYRIRLEFLRSGQIVRAYDESPMHGRHPFPEWEPGEVVRQTRPVYLGTEASPAPLEARFSLVRWGIGPAEPESVTVKLLP
jgi:4-amino-4-deoxy-L-arabinose transferase-like glycosyltransferase